MKIDLNYMCKAKLYPKGQQIWIHQGDSLLKEFRPDLVEKFQDDYRKSIDKDGYIETQLHDLFRVLGQYLSVGIAEYIHPIIEIEVENENP